ncbi:protease modulator HflC [Limibacillus halophilus]|uniref:Protein HflC n=1 Tax=Limibacillus halophilus TaxID=1579333 RepID=A0A839SXV8_9PROT|nr:protease modulator HflC [Limibacillus halophilus]MBB3066919.1 membrane protease subunit HflC [Limibacillus halophilus]
MKGKLPLILGVIVVLLGILGSSALFVVDETKQVIVLQFGDPKRTISEPGLNVKVPFIQNVIYYEKRVLNFDPPVERVILADQKPLNVNSYARYRISNPLRFYQTVTTEQGLSRQLGQIINSSVRSVLGNVNLASVLSEERTKIMAEIRTKVNTQAGRFGIDVVDVRIGRADLPDETSKSVFARMQSEREREAAEFRAEGFEQAQRIRATADREATVIRAEAKRESDILRGQGDALRTTTLANAYSTDPEFFRFFRTMEAYKQSLQGTNSYLVLDPKQMEFFNFFGTSEEGVPAGQ